MGGRVILVGVVGGKGRGERREWCRGSVEDG